MFPNTVFQRSANDMGGAGDDLGAMAGALTDGSIAASPSAPAPGQEPPVDDRPPVPHNRFKEVNDKLAVSMARVEELQLQLTQQMPPATPVSPVAPVVPAPAPQGASIGASEIGKAVAQELAKHGLVDMAAQAKRMQLAEWKTRLVAQLNTMPGFDEQRDLPRISAKMTQAKCSALDAFKLLSFDEARPPGPIAHDVPRGGQPTGPFDQRQHVDLHQPMSSTDREQAVTNRYKGIIDRDPAMRRLLELD